MYLVTAREMREMDRQTIEDFGLPGQVLMENAARRALDMFIRHFPDFLSQKICILVGKGNNGGDALVMARYLVQQGATVTTLVLAPRERISGDARTNLILLETLLQHHPKQPLHFLPDGEAFAPLQTTLGHQDLFVDGILGTGLTGPVRGFLSDVIARINETGKPGVQPGHCLGPGFRQRHGLGECIHACATATFGLAKAGHFLEQGPRHTGDLEVMDIGIPDYIVKARPPRLQVTRPQEVSGLFPPRDTAAHKGRFGHLLGGGRPPGKKPGPPF